MNDELIFRIIFMTVYTIFAANRYLARTIHGFHTSIQETFKQATIMEGKSVAALRATMFPFEIAGAILYVIYPSWMAWISILFPVWIRWVGVCLAIICLPLLVWSGRTLGKQWAPCLRLREDHKLVTDGPYRWIRHPIYATLIAFRIALTLESANLLIALRTIAAIFLTYSRVGKEEKMMIERFGEEYRSYMKRTPGFLPHPIRPKKPDS